MAGEAYFHLAGYEAAVAAWEADQMAVAQTLAADPAYVLRGVHKGEPQTYGGKFPAFVLYRTTTRGKNRAAGRMMPGSVTSTVMVVDLATTRGGGSTNSGRGSSEAETGPLVYAFLDRLWERVHLGGRVQDLEVSITDADSYDAQTRTVFTVQAGNVKWVSYAEIVATL
jgi:hypothetical protein